MNECRREISQLRNIPARNWDFLTEHHPLLHRITPGSRTPTTLAPRKRELNILQARTIKDPWVARELQRVRTDKATEAKTRGEVIAALLDENQKKAFAEIRSQELENRIEAQTYAGMQRLQQAVPHLTAEQKDKAFAALSEDKGARVSAVHAGRSSGTA